MLRRLVGWIGLATLLACGPICAGAYAQTIIIGGPGGGNFDDRCPNGAYLIGVNVIAGKDMNTIGPVCQNFVNGHATGAVFGLHTWGKWEPNGHFGITSAVRCPADMAAQGMQVRVAGTLVHSVALRCRNPNAHDYGMTSYSGTGGGGTDYEKPVDCGGGAISNGVIGRYGSLIDALGLNCQIIAVPAPPPPPPPPPQKTVKHTGRPKMPDPAPAPGPAPAPVVTGTPTRARIDTTIYDKPAGKEMDYIKAGDPVTIVSCNEIGWCLISKPRDGAVWGPDLKR